MLEDLTAQMLFKGGKDGSLPLVVRAFRRERNNEFRTTSSGQRIGTADLKSGSEENLKLFV